MVNKHNALVASAQVLTGSRHQDPMRTRKAWQHEAWMFYDETGPLRYASNWQANLVSRARLLAAEVTNLGDEPSPVDTGPAAEAVANLSGGVNGQSQLLKSAAVQLGVPGVGYLVGTGSDEQTWRMYSADVLRIKVVADPNSPAVYELQESEKEWVELPPESLVVKVWRPHERYHWEPDSPARAALGDLRELRRVRQYIDATLVSRLAGAGILVIPQEASFPTADGESDDHPFVTEILEAMMTAVREPGSAAQVVPIPVEMPGEFTDSFKHLTFHTELSEKILDMRESALRQCAITLDVPAEVLTGMAAANHWGCLSEDTEILTRLGWRTHDQVQEGDEVLTLNHDTGVSEWQPVLRMNRYSVTDVELLAMDGQAHSSLSTLNHRWATVSRITGNRQWKESRTLSQADMIPTCAPHKGLPAEPKWSDDLVELVAWAWTGGRLSSGLMIAQSPVVNPSQEARIRALLVRLFGLSVQRLARGMGPAWREQSRPGFEDVLGVNHQLCTLFHLNKAAADLIKPVLDSPKVVSLDFIQELTAAQLELFIQVSFLGDGRHRDCQDITQRHPEQLDAIELAAILAGRMVKRGMEWLGSDGQGGRALYHTLTIYQRDNVQPMRSGMVRRKQYTGVVWCPTTLNGSWFARRNGTFYFTGNSWQIEESAVKVHAEPLLELITSGLTSGFLHPVLLAQGMPREEVESFVIWADTSELSTRPDKSDDALRLYDRGEASGEALRRETGLSESDAMDDEEKADWAYKRLVTVPQHSLMALEGLGIDIPESTIPQPLDLGGGGTEVPGSEPIEQDGESEEGPPEEDDRTNGDAPFDVRTLVLEGFVHRALERAGNKLRSRFKSEESLKECEADLVHTCLGGTDTLKLDARELLVGSWARIPQIASDLGLDPVQVTHCLEEYCLTLLTKGYAYERDQFCNAIAGIKLNRRLVGAWAS